MSEIVVSVVDVYTDQTELVFYIQHPHYDTLLSTQTCSFYPNIMFPWVHGVDLNKTLNGFPSYLDSLLKIIVGSSGLLFEN